MAEDPALESEGSTTSQDPEIPADGPVTVSTPETPEVAEWRDKYIRLLADFDNHRKRVVREVEESRKFSNESILRTFLPVLDNLDRALQHVGTKEISASECLSLVEGIRLTQKQFVELLEKNQVTRVPSEGVSFDPEIHEAVGFTESATQPEGTIVEVYQQGYKMHNRLIRPAMVTVSKGKASGA